MLAVGGATVAVRLVSAGGDRPDRDRTVAVVCRVASLAGDGDAGAAQHVFINEAHEPLHALAQAAADGGDRRAAARLLEAKEVVESATNGPTAADADALVTATVAATRAAGRSPEGCA